MGWKSPIDHKELQKNVFLCWYLGEKILTSGLLVSCKKRATRLSFTSIASWILAPDGVNGNEGCRIPVTAICFEEKRFYVAGPHWKHNAQPVQVVPAVPC